MALPPGFDPETGTLGRVGNGVRRIMPSPIHTAIATAAPAYRPRSGWQKFSDGVSSIGEWIQDKGYYITWILLAIPALATLISLLVWVVKTFSHEGFFMGVLALGAAGIGAVIAYYVFCLIAAVLYIGIYLIGYIFYNAYTLLIALVIAGSIAIGVGIANADRRAGQDAQTSAPAYTVYRCTASQLNVRSAPSTSARILGKVSKGESVQVYGFEGDFARIRWNGQDAYVSKKYISE